MMPLLTGSLVPVTLSWDTWFNMYSAVVLSLYFIRSSANAKMEAEAQWEEQRKEWEKQRKEAEAQLEEQTKEWEK